jgi:NAD(P)H-hydrate epimerase
VLAIDLPSGLDCDTGRPLGPCVRAEQTATFVAPKKGFELPESKEWTGAVHVIDIGVPRIILQRRTL